MTYLSRFVSTIVMPFRILASWFTRITPGFQKLGRLSPAARVAWMTFLFLLIVLGAGVIRFTAMKPTERAERDWLLYFALAFAMMIPITIAMYWLVRLLLQKPVSVMPDVDRAWKIGLDGLQRHGIPVRKIPLFVIVGLENAQQVRDIMGAIQFDALVAPSEGENNPLLWYGNQSSVFLFIPGTSCLSAVSRSRGKQIASSAVSHVAAPANSQGTSTINADDIDSFTSVVSPPASHQTLGHESPAHTPLTQSGAAQPASPQAMGTLNADTIGSVGPPSVLTETTAPTAQLTHVTEDEINIQTRRLSYVCSLLKTARRPVSPINGLMVIAPFDLIESGSGHSLAAIQRDLSVLREQLAVRCPVTLLVSEMERVEGFLELTKRLSPDDIYKRRIGKGSAVWGDPSESRIEAIATHAVGAFEDLVYVVFRNPEILRRAYNGKLVWLLCRTRGDFRGRLQNFSKHAFGYDLKTTPELAQTLHFFSGCYFAATGRKADHQAGFVNAVFAKLIEEQGKLEWAPKARQEDQTMQTIANLFCLLGMVAVMAIVVGIVMMKWNS